MNSNVITESLTIQQIYTEYLSLINKYHNIKRPAILIRYLNINAKESIIDKDMNSTYKKYSDNGIIYDIYEQTPVYYISSVVNDLVESNDLAGEQFQGNLSITTYSILEPRINDLVIFPYSPLNTNKEIWRVDNIRSVINAMYSNISVRWFELTLDYAPITSIEQLNYSKHFSYLLSEEKNIPIELYKKFILILQKLEQILEQFNDQFNSKYELYFYNGKAPIIENYKLYNFLSVSSKNYNRYFERLRSPFGVLKYSPSINQSLLINDNIRNITELTSPDVIDTSLITDILKFNGDVNIYTVVKLLELFEQVLNEIRKA